MLALLFESLIQLIWSYPLPSLPIQLCVFSFSFKTNVCYPNVLGCVVYHWSVVDILGASLLERMPPSHCERLTIANSSMTRVGLCARLPTPSWDLFYIGLHRFVCAVPTTVNFYVQLPRCVQKTMFSCSHLQSQVLNTLSVSSSTVRALSWREHIFYFSDMKVNHGSGRLSG